MSDDEQQVNQAERDAIGNYFAAHNRRTGTLVGNAIEDGLREHEERLASEADNDEENGS